MKNILILVWLTMVFSVNSSKGQSFTSTPELQDICNQLVESLNNKDFAGRIIVFDFTDQANTPTELGAYFAEEFSNYLVNASGKFTVIDRSSIAPSAKDKSFINNLTTAVAEEAGNYLDEDEAKIANSARKGMKIFMNPKDKRLKNVDAIAYGTITTIGDYFRLNIKVKEKKGDGLIATVGGDISNTDALARLNENTLEKPEPTAQASTERGGGYSASPSGNASHVFRKQHLNFELIKCIKSGRYVECYLRITSEGRDTELSFRGQNARIFNQNGGTEYQPVSINIADNTNHYRVEKALISDTPVTSILTFEPQEDVDVISRLEVKYYTPLTQEFVLDMRDIFVE